MWNYLTNSFILILHEQLIQAACSMYGAWGKAIANTNGTLYQLRALDWDTTGPFQKVNILFSQIII